MAHAERWMLLGADAPFARPALVLRGVLPVQARCLPGVLFGLRWALERRANDISHFMAAFVESRVIALARIGRIQRKEEHSSRRAKSLLNAWRMPSWPEAFGREYDQFASGLCDCIAAFLLAWAHESADAGAAGSDAGGVFGEGEPFGRILCELSRAFEGCYDRHVENRGVSVCEPFVPGKIDARYATEEAGVFMAKISARRVFFDVLPEGGELALLLDDPIVPIWGEDVWWRRRAVRRTLRKKPFVGRVLRRAASAAQIPVCAAKSLRKLAYQHSERHSFRSVFYLDQEVDMIRHDHEGRDFFEAAPFVVESANDCLESTGGFVLDESVRADFGKGLDPLDRFQGDHVIKRRFVVEIEETGHTKIF